MTTQMQAGMIGQVYRSARDFGDTTNGGATSRVDEVTLIDDDLPELFWANDDRPAMKIVRRTIGGEEYVHAEPVEPSPEGHTDWMFGGNYIASSDGRWRRALGSRPIPVHDRCETWEQYEMMSR
jgi:hypothetical protein